MLRRTVRRAFSGCNQSGSLPLGSRESHRDLALDHLFRQLRARLEFVLQTAPVGGSSGGDPVADDSGSGGDSVPGGAEAERASLRGAGTSLALSQPRALSHGIEFVLSSPTTALHFVQTLEGWLRVDRSAVTPDGGTGERRPQELLGLHRQDGALRAVRKSLRSASATPFRYVSVQELARSYLEQLRRGET